MNWLPDLGKGWLIVIPLAILLVICVETCRPEVREPDHQARITHVLSAATVDPISPPAGPFNIRRDTSRYFKAYVPATERTYYIEVSVSPWSIASGSPVYRYQYWREMPFGMYLPIKT